MSPRKPTVDDIDDVDDEDGAVEQQAREASDLKLRVRRADDVPLGGAGGEDEAAPDPQER
jgi:hypothetical protein